MGGLVLPLIMEKLPFEVEILYEELDGNFPNHPADPIQPENLVDLQRLVVERGADIGLAFDGDADRVFLVDEHAACVSGSLTTALVANAMLDKEPGATILYNCICSKVVPELVQEKGGTAVRTRVGHSFIKADMERTGAVFGGEHSGHYYFRDNFRADSGIITTMVVLELMGSTGKSLSQLVTPFARYAASGEINTEVPNPKRAVELVAAHLEGTGVELDHLDGLTANYSDWWFNLRPSNTEPLLRLNVEARDVESVALHVAQVQAMIRTLLNND
jgi:phosphomannomutase